MKTPCLTSEDDTFRILARPTRYEMSTIYLQFVLSFDGDTIEYQRLKRRVFIDNGWTQEEFLKTPGLIYD